MDQRDTLFISSWAWTLSAELVLDFLCEVLCEKDKPCFCSSSLSSKFLFAKNSSPLKFTFNGLSCDPSHQGILASGKMLLPPFLLLPPGRHPKMEVCGPRRPDLICSFFVASLPFSALNETNLTVSKQHWDLFLVCVLSWYPVPLRHLLCGHLH